MRHAAGVDMTSTPIAVVKTGPAFWSDVLAWGRDRGLLTPTELGILRVVAAGRTPSEKQSSRAVEALSKLQSEGYTGDLRVSV